MLGSREGLHYFTLEKKLIITGTAAGLHLHVRYV